MGKLFSAAMKAPWGSRLLLFSSSAIHGFHSRSTVAAGTPAKTCELQAAGRRKGRDKKVILPLRKLNPEHFQLNFIGQISVT